MKRFITNVFVILFVLSGIFFTLTIPAVADSADDEIRAIKKRLAELEDRTEKQSDVNDRIGKYIESHKIKVGMRVVHAWYQYLEDGRGDNHDTVIPGMVLSI